MVQSTSSVAVILFPGSNSEVETVRALKRVGLDAEVIRWNEVERVPEFDAYVLPGGFAFEDRGRSGMVASFEPIMDEIRKQVDLGKMVVGICNGCQILVDSGFIRGPGGQRLAMGWNVRKKNGQVQGRWVSRTPWMKMSGKMAEEFGEEVVMKAPVAHGEGRFACLDEGVFDELEKNRQVILRYCTEEGEVSDEYPVTPNGAPKAIAGICDPTGRIVAWMPHPERVYPRKGSDRADTVFEWMREKLKIKNEKRKNTLADAGTPSEGGSEIEVIFNAKPEVDLEILTELMITDNEAWTIEQVARRVLVLGADMAGFRLLKRVWWGVGKLKIKNAKFKSDTASDIIRTGELANVNKEKVTVVMDGEVLEYHKNDGRLAGGEADGNGVRYLVLERDDTVGQMKSALFAEHHAELGVGSILRGVLWTVIGVSEADAEKLLAAGVFHNSQSMKVAKK